MHYPEFEAMIRPAKLYPELWRLLLGLLLAVFIYVATIALLMTLLFAAVQPIAFFGWIQRIQAMTEPVPTLLAFATFPGMLLGVAVAAAACHFRGPGTLFGPRGEWARTFFLGLAVTLPVYAVLLALDATLNPARENLPWDAWLRFLPWALPLLFVQITAEEVLFRGYLQQQLAARFRWRWVWMLVPAALFAPGHWDPDLGHGSWLPILAALVFGLIAADLTARFGSLGPAMALHFANNFFGLLVVSTEGSVTGLSRWVTPFAADELERLALSVGLSILINLALWRLLIRVLDR